jgi:beta-lactamase regulating signal transducer with metallopeptidase domain
MILKTFLENNQIAEFILNLAYYSIIVMFLGWIISRLVKRKPAPLRSGILLMTLLGLLLVPIISITYNVFNVSSYKSSLPSTWNLNYNIIEGASPNTEISKVEKEPIQKESRDQADTEETSFFYWFGSQISIKKIINIFGLVWIAGILVIVLRLLYDTVFVIGFKRGLIEINDSRIKKMLKVLPKRFPNMRIPSVYLSPAIECPIALGFVKPVIIIPFNLYKNLNNSELKSILLHEISHIFHKDHIIMIFQRMVTALNWWNPLVYTISHDLSQAREEISDNYAIIENSSKEYAECLVNLAEKTNLISRLPVSIGMATPYISLKDRVKNILSKERNMETKLKKPLAVVFCMATILISTMLVSYGFAFGPEVIELKDLLKPSVLRVDTNDLFVRDGYSIKIFSLKDYKLKLQFGNKGEGPGEFKRPPRISILPDSIFVRNASKIFWFTKEGKLIKEMKKSPADGIGVLTPVGEKFIGTETDLSDRTSFKTSTYNVCVAIFNSELENTKEIFRYQKYYNMVYAMPGVNEDAKWNMIDPILKYDYDRTTQKIFVVDASKGFYIEVFDENGDKLYTIDKKMDQIKVTKDYKEQTFEAFKEKMKKSWQYMKKRKFVYPEYFPQIMTFNVADGKIYVSTFKRKNNKTEFIILDQKGEILKKVFLPVKVDGDRILYYSIANNKFYQILENEEKESWELHIHDFN